MGNERVTWQQAFQEEQNRIEARRLKDGRNSSRQPGEGLTGLAISGGGIRSATFALGVLEALRRLGLLPKIDYLSTVSGGGYTGAWLSANCQRAEEKNRPSWLTTEADWEPSVDHLRRYSNYLSPTLGFFSADTWSMAAIWFRNTLLVQITVILAIAVALLLPRPLYQLFEYWPNMGYFRWATIFLFTLGAVGIAGNHLRLSSSWGSKFLVAKSWRPGLIASAILLGLAAWLGFAFQFEPFSDEAMPLFPGVAIAFLLIAGAFCLQPVVVRLLSLIWSGSNSPDEINYTQAWVQGVVVVPMMAVGFLVAAILWGQSHSAHSHLSQVSTFGGFFADAWRYWSFPLAVVFASLWLFSFCSARATDEKKRWFEDWRRIAVALLSPIPAMLTLHALLSAIMVLLHKWAAEGPEGNWLAYIWAPAMVLYSFSLTVVVLIGMLGRQSKEGVREWWSRFGAWLIIYGVGWMVVSAAASFGPLLSAVLFQESTWKWGASLTGGWLGTTLAGLLAGNSDATGKRATKSTKDKALELIARIAPFVFIFGLLVAISTVLHLVILNSSSIHWATAAELQARHWEFLNAAAPAIVAAVIGFCAFSVLLFAMRVDINEFSLNAFYRSRLVRCYLGATRVTDPSRSPQNFTGFDDDDDLSLPKLTAGPFHIVNCALNLGGSKDLALHTRHSAIFTLTSLRCGTRYHDLGYWSTEEFCGPTAIPTLGQAIAVSGAAASPNMGYHTSPVVAFVMTLFNVRLGWWFPNPHCRKSGNSSPWFSLRYLVNELFGGANDQSSYVAVSDGGHFENLAAYELIKRQCRLIIISDAECDSEYGFEGLGRLIRMCKVDFGVTISIDVKQIRRAKSKWSTRRFAIGSIQYPGEPGLGILIYLKASMTGQESTDVLQYKSAHPTFPHESTGNQFYAEDQFESYRHLGYDIAMQTFEGFGRDINILSLAKALYDREFAEPTETQPERTRPAHAN